MPYPPKPQIQTSYTAVEQALGDGTLPGQEMDNDFANVVTALSALNDFVRGVTRSDGRLGNGTVTRDTLAADILLGVAPPEPWQTGRAYASPDTVFGSNRFYVALTDHVSTDFASDLAAGRWLLLADFTLVQAAAVAAQAAAEAARDDVLERYIGPLAAEPTTAPGGAPLLAGMLYFNTVLQTMFVYNGSVWGSVSSAVSGVRNQFRYTATAGQTVFTGADATGATPVFGSANLVTVYRNGVRLVPTVDFTVSVALSSVTLAVGAALNDVLVVEVFGNFQAQPPEAAQVSQITVGGATFTGAATQGEAETGTATDRLMTPLRTAQAISALRPLPLAVGQGGTGATTPAAARTALGATTVGNAVFTAADVWAARWALGASSVGHDVFRAADAATARTALGASSLGVGQAWHDMTAHRTNDVTYQNTTGGPIEVSVVSGSVNVNTSLRVGATAGTLHEVSAFGSGTVHRISTCTAIVPNGHFYRHGGPVARWMELR